MRANKGQLFSQHLENISRQAVENIKTSLKNTREGKGTILFDIPALFVQLM